MRPRRRRWSAKTSYIAHWTPAATSIATDARNNRQFVVLHEQAATVAFQAAVELDSVCRLRREPSACGASSVRMAPSCVRCSSEIARWKGRNRA